MTPRPAPSSRLPRPPAPATRTAARRALALGAGSAAAAASFTAVARAVARRDTRTLDAAAASTIRPKRTRPLDPKPRAYTPTRAQRAVGAFAPVGKWWVYVPAAAAVGAAVLRGPKRARRARRAPHPEAGDRWPAAAAVLLAGATAAALAPVLDRWLPQPPTPPGHGPRRKPVFPSGHALGPGTVALASAYVLVREGVGRPGAVIPAALAIPLATAGGKLFEEKHWITDVLGGYLGAAAIAGAWLAAYEMARHPTAAA